MRTDRLIETVDLDEFALADRDHSRIFKRQQDNIEKKAKNFAERQKVFRNNKL